MANTPLTTEQTPNDSTVGGSTQSTINSQTDVAELRQLRADIQYQALKNDRIKENTEYRRVLTIWTIVVVTCWLIVVLLILCFNTFYFKLDPAVLVALLGTSTLNILGLPYIVLKGYFPSKTDTPSPPSLTVGDNV